MIEHYDYASDTKARLTGSADVSWEDEGVASVLAPSNTVELDFDLLDLLLSIEREEVETFDGILASANTSEFPLPDDLVVGLLRDEDAERVNACNGC